MNDVDASSDSIEETVKEVSMLDKVLCQKIVLFYGACIIRNHVMMVMELTPSSSPMACIRKPVEKSGSRKS